MTEFAVEDWGLFDKTGLFVLDWFKVFVLNLYFLVNFNEDLFEVFVLDLN